MSRILKLYNENFFDFIINEIKTNKYIKRRSEECLLYQRKYQKKYREKNREKYNLYQREWQKKYIEFNREKYNLFQRKWRANNHKKVK